VENLYDDLSLGHLQELWAERVAETQCDTAAGHVGFAAQCCPQAGTCDHEPISQTDFLAALGLSWEVLYAAGIPSLMSSTTEEMLKLGVQS
jgi:hypothetical protein